MKTRYYVLKYGNQLDILCSIDEEVFLWDEYYLEWRVCHMYSHNELMFDDDFTEVSEESLFDAGVSPYEVENVVI